MLLPVNCEGIIIITVKWDCQYIFTVNWENTIYCELGIAFYFLCDLRKWSHYGLAYLKKFLALLRSPYPFFRNNIPICRSTYDSLMYVCTYMSNSPMSHPFCYISKIMLYFKKKTRRVKYVKLKFIHM